MTMVSANVSKKSGSEKGNQGLVIGIIVLGFLVFVGLIILVVLGVYTIVLQEDMAVLENRVNFLESEYAGAYKAPYVVMHGREAEAVFKKIDGELITWVWPADSFEDAFTRGHYKRTLIPETFGPLLDETCKLTNDQTYAIYQSYYDFCDYSCKNYYDCDCYTPVAEFYDSYLEIVDECQNDVADVKKGGLQYESLSYSNGNTVSVISVMEFVEPDLFSDVIDTLYDPAKSDKENIEEIWNVNNQLTTYSTELTDTPRYSLETLSEGGGDCEDKAILVASLLKAVPKDWKVQLVYMDSDNPKDPQEVNHVLVYVDTGTFQTYIETTAEYDGVGYWDETIEGWYYDV